MNRTLSRLLPCVCLLAVLAACASSPRAAEHKVTGLYSDMRYNAEGDDVLGVEIFLVQTESGYYAIYQSSEGEPAVPVVLPAEVSGTSVRFQIPADTDARGRFDGRVDAKGLTGTFSGNAERITLERKPSYWQ